MLIETLGWLGTTGTFGAYLLLSRGWLASQSLTYSTLNVVGGLLAALASAAYGAWPSVVSNIVWAVVGMHAVGRTLTDGRRAERLERDAVAAESSEPVRQDCFA
jgi:hypothetical protein